MVKAHGIDPARGLFGMCGNVRGDLEDTERGHGYAEMNVGR